MSEGLPVLALVSDMIFSSKISAVARQLGSAISIVRSANQLAGREGRRLIVDLNLAGAIEAAAQWKSATGGQVIGFVSHTDQQTIAAARNAGLDQVMARSRFVEVLPDLLA